MSTACTLGIRGRQRLKKHSKDIILVALAAGLAFLLDARIAERQKSLATDLAERGEAIENLRFVRQIQVDGAELKPFGGLNLRDVSLAGISLPCEDLARRRGCADFRQADLLQADLQGADLRGAMFQSASLDDVRLIHANLEEANLEGATLLGAFLFSANLRGARLRDAFLIGARLYDADMRDADLTGAYLYKTHFGGADLRGADLGGLDLSGVHLEGANLSGARLGADALPEGEVCFDDSTVWPAGTRVPKPADFDACGP